MARAFVEEFATNASGMYGWVGNQEGPKPLEYLPNEDGGAVLSRSPWCARESALSPLRS